jgi:hypothetical protein
VFKFGWLTVSAESGEDFSMLRLALLAPLPQVGGILLMASGVK